MRFKIIKLFDRLEDKIRATLSRRPIIYTLIGAFAIVLFWRGVWLTADMFEFLTGPVSIILSVVILLLTGLFVSFFIGEQVIISGLRKEQKLIEKEEIEIETEKDILIEIKNKIEKIEREMNDPKKSKLAKHR